MSLKKDPRTSACHLLKIVGHLVLFQGFILSHVKRVTVECYVCAAEAKEEVS